MDTNEQKCKCGNSIKPKTSSKTFQTFFHDSDVFYDVPDENDSAMPTTSSKLQPSNSVALLMQKIADPQYFKLVLENVVEIAENLMNSFERAMQESLAKFRKAIAGLNAPEVSSSINDNRTRDKFHSDGCEFSIDRRNRSDRLNITVDPVTVTVPITLYIQPNVHIEKIPDEFTPEAGALPVSDDVEHIPTPSHKPTREASVERSMTDEVQPIEDLVEHSLSDEVEPIRTASISIDDGRIIQAPFGLPKTIRFSEDITPLERQDSKTETLSETLPESEFDLEDARKNQAEKEDFIDRSRTTQNDRNRDHSNLSHKPNIEAPAGPRQQPAGRRQTHQAKDKNDENDNGNNTNKERSPLENYVTPREASLCSNVSQDGYRNLSSEAGSSIVKLSFSTNACADLQGSYKCFCGEEEGSCHKFWCQRYEVLENERKTVEGSVKPFVSQKKLIERKEDPETTIAQTASCSQNMKLDFETKPVYECPCVRKSLIVSSCENEQIDSQELNNSSRTGLFHNERKENNGPSLTAPNLTQKTSSAELRSQSKYGTVQILNESSKNPCVNSESLISIATEELCPCEDFENSRSNTESSGRLYLKESKSHEGKHARVPNLNGSYCSVGTAITPRQTMDENVIPLLKGIFDVLQAMREDKLHLGPIASKNIDIYLDEPFNALPKPPPAPPSSPKFPKELLGISCDDPQSCIFKPSRNNWKFEENKDHDFINSEDNLSILEPPERDVDDFEKNNQEMSTKSQRLIPVDMDLLRTDEELIWEPDSNFDRPEDEAKEEERRVGSLQLKEGDTLKTQLKHFPIPSNEQLKICPCESCPRERLQDYNIEEAGLLRMKRSSSLEDACLECICGEADNCHRECSTNIVSYSDKQTTTTASMESTFQELNLDQEKKNNQNPLKIQVSQATQLNSVSLQYLTSGSEELEGLSEEKLLKTSGINKSKEAHLKTINYQNKISKLDVGTDCPNFDSADFGNDNRSSIKSCQYSQERTTNPHNQEMSQFIESILFDLKAMDSFRKINTHWQSFARLPCPSTGGWQRPSRDLSYPVTIETVQELGTNSLFVKWRVQNIGNIGGYEIFLDGRLTNRYFNCIHRAAVICDVNLQCPHRIILRAQPLLPPSTSLLATHSCSSSNTKCPSNTPTRPEASCPQPDGSVWYPSVYHFEPNSISAPISAVLY